MSATSNLTDNPVPASGQLFQEGEGVIRGYLKLDFAHLLAKGGCHTIPSIRNIPSLLADRQNGKVAESSTRNPVFYHRYSHFLLHL